MKNRGNININNNDKRSVSANKKFEKQNIKEDKNNNNNNIVQVKKDNDGYKEFQKGVDFITTLVHEYLIKRDYIKTLDCFQDEITTKLKNKLYYATKANDLVLDSTLESLFNTGKKAEFFKLYNRLIPSHIKQRETALEKLEFFLQIYFAVFPILPTIIQDKKVKC